MKITVSKVYNFDLDTELKRINKCFKGERRARQLTILDAFKAGNFNKCIELYNALPYDNKEECPEQEYVGEYFEFISDCIYEDYKIEKIEN